MGSHLRFADWLRLFALALPLSGCVSAFSLRQMVQTVSDAQRPIAEGLNYLDAACQGATSTPEGLAECRGYRDRARAGLRTQLDALGGVSR